MIEAKIEPGFNSEQALETKTAEQFFEEKEQEMAVLVYCNKTDTAKFEELAKANNYTPRRDVTEFKDLRELKQCDCIIQTH